MTEMNEPDLLTGDAADALQQVAKANEMIQRAHDLLDAAERILWTSYARLRRLRGDAKPH
jgi:hypothetical protein